MDLSFIADIFTSGGLGGIIGGVTGLVMKIQERKEKAQDQAHEIALTRLSILEAKSEQAHELAVANKQIQRAETEGEIEIESKEADAFVASQKNQSNDGFLRWVRPAITGYLLVLSTLLAVRIFGITGGLESLTDDKLSEMLLQIIDGILFLTTTTVCWWFAARGTSRKA